MSTDVSTSQLSAVQIDESYDVERLQKELDALDTNSFQAQRSFDRTALAAPTTVDWRVLPLRSPGGDPLRTDPGGPGIDEYRGTPLLADVPYLASILADVPANLRTARLMSLGPGASVDEHRDYPYGLPAGWIRLHVPIVTNDGAVLVIDGVEHRWHPGTLWYGDFSRPHAVRNTGDTRRVHLVMDCFVGPALLDAMPAGFLDTVRWSEVLLERTELPLRVDQLAPLCCDVPVPAGYLTGDHVDALRTEDTPDRPGRLVVRDGRLHLETGDGTRIALVHIGEGEFRSVGWTTERTIKVDTDGTGAVRVRFRMRYGSRLSEAVRAPVTGWEAAA